MRMESISGRDQRPDVTTWSFPTSLVGFTDKHGKRPRAECLWTYAALHSQIGAAGETFETSITDVAHITGLSHHGAKRALERLRMIGLIVKHDQLGDRWMIELQDPSLVQRARLGDRDDGQLLLPAVDDQPAATCAPDARAHALADALAPLRLRPKTSSEASPQGLKSKSGFQHSLSLSQGASACARASGADRPDGLPIREALEGLIGEPSNGMERSEKIERLARWIHDQVGDRALEMSPCTRAAEAVVNGRLKRRELDRILSFVEKKTRQVMAKAVEEGVEAEVRRFAYFIGALKTRFREDRIPWDVVADRDRS